MVRKTQSYVVILSQPQKKHPENQQESSNITSVARYASGLCDTNLQLTVKPLNLFFLVQSEV